jgi:hypothetical protein
LPELTDPQRGFMAFVHKRHRNQEDREAGLPWPWGTDRILQKKFFCNMYRELDKTTIWIREHWRERHHADPDLWFSVAVARMVNYPDSLAEIGYPVPWDAGHFVEVLRARKARGEKSFHQAYKPPTPSAGGNRIDFVAHQVLTPMWEARERLRKIVRMTLDNAHKELMTCYHLGSFPAAQIIADLKYVEPMKSAPDWHTFAASGDGSRRGLNRILGQSVDAYRTEECWRIELRKLHERLTPHYVARGLPVPHAQDLQNQLCEWDKYERVRLTPGKASLRCYRGPADRDAG